MDTLLASILSSFFLALPATPAERQESADGGDGGWYIGGGTGISQGADVTYEGLNLSGRLFGEPRLKHDPVPLTLTTGYTFGNNIRLEGEVFRRPFDVSDDRFTFLPHFPDFSNPFPRLGGSQASGNLEYTGAVINAFYVIDTGTKWSPYAGMGAGRVNLAWDIEATVPGDVLEISGSGATAMVQFQAGVDYRVTPRWSVFANYRRTSITDLVPPPAPRLEATTSPLVIEGHHTSSWQGGLRVRLGTPAAPAERRESADGGDGGWYVGGGVGISPDTALNYGATVPGAFLGVATFLRHDPVSLKLTTGYAFDNNTRLEGEVFRVPFTQFDSSAMFSTPFPDVVLGHMEYRGAVFNAFYDIDTGTKWVPYVGVGAGVVNIAIDTEIMEGDDTFAGSGSGTTGMVQFQTGVDYRVTPRWAVFANYRRASFQDLASHDPEASVSTLTTDARQESSWEFGLKVRLGHIGGDGR